MYVRGKQVPDARFAKAGNGQALPAPFKGKTHLRRGFRIPVSIFFPCCLTSTEGARTLKLNFLSTFLKHFKKLKFRWKIQKWSKTLYLDGRTVLEVVKVGFVAHERSFGPPKLTFKICADLALCCGIGDSVFEPRGSARIDTSWFNIFYRLLFLFRIHKNVWQCLA